MSAELTEAESLRYVLVAKIARERLLEIGQEYDWRSFLAACDADQAHPEFRSVRAWRNSRMAEVDAALDEALDAADAAILAHA